MTNQMLLQAAGENEHVLSFGQVVPPALIGTEEQRITQAKTIDHVPIRVVARVSMTRRRLEELSRLLQRQLG
jgi:hypothetical protein